jgi:hypothetical protein
MTKHTAVAPQPLINPKILLAAGVAVLIVGAVIVIAKPDPTVSSPPPRLEAQAPRLLTANETNFNFGSISMAAGNVTHRYWIRNTGSTPIVVQKMYTSCMCTTAALVKAGRKSPPSGMPGHGVLPTLNEPLQPNEAAMVEVVFDPAAHGPGGIGRVERVVTIQTDLERPLELAFVATVTP